MSVRIYTNKYEMLYLDIRYGDGQRKRSATKLKDTVKNRELLEKNIIPHLEVQILNGEYNPNANNDVVPVTVKEYGYRSLNRRRKKKRRKHVQKAYLQHFESKIIPYFGDRLITHISAMNLLDWQNEMLEKYQVSSVKKFRTVFNGIFEDARKELINGKKMISENPFKDVEYPEDEEEFIDYDNEDELIDKKINPFSLDEINDLLSKSSGYMRNFIGIASFTGIRPGEIVSLRWSDIDFENEIIRVRRTRVQGENGPPKKKASIRDVEMLPGVKDFFQNQYEITGHLGSELFVNSSKLPFYSHDYIAKRFKDLLSKGDTRYLYQLRHSFATLMITEGEDILWVSRMMGHKDSNITLQTYAKAYEISKKKSERIVRASFLNKRHSMGIVNNTTYDKAQEVGV